MSSIERHQTSAYALAIADDERAFDLMMRKARVLCKIPGLRKELQGNPDAVAGIMLSLQGFNLEPNLTSINNSFDWIEGKAVATTQFVTALGRRGGWSIKPVVREARRAVARAEHMRHEAVEVEFSAEDAIRAHRLDAWVEQWRKVRTRDGERNVKDTFVVRVNGEPRTWNGDQMAPLPEPLPQWVEEQVDLLQVKRYDAWWNYSTDMFWKSAVRRVVRIACPEVMLGIRLDDDSDEITFSPPTAVSSWEAAAPVGGEPDDEVEVEVIPPPAAADHSGDPF